MRDPLKLSVSKTKTFSSCAKQYEYRYVIKLKKPDKDYHTFGKCLHKALEDFHQAYVKGSLLLPHEEMFNAWKNAKAQYATQMTKEALKECFDILSSYLKWVSKRSPDFNAKVLSTEEAFSFPLTDNIILNGYIDKINIDNDGVLHISDYKSTKNKKYLKDDWFQLLTYAYVVMTNKPELDKVRVSYILLRHDFEHISKEVSRDEVMAVKQTYLDYARDIEQTMVYEANPTFMCKFCDYIEECSDGQKFIFGKQQTHGQIDW
jgi:ATP-dependent helicase/DNAse subunit B